MVRLVNVVLTASSSTGIKKGWTPKTHMLDGLRVPSVLVRHLFRSILHHIAVSVGS